MRTSGRGTSEKAMVLIPAGVLLVSMMLFAGGPVQFLRILNVELAEVFGFFKQWVTTWVM